MSSYLNNKIPVRKRVATWAHWVTDYIGQRIDTYLVLDYWGTVDVYILRISQAFPPGNRVVNH